MADETAPVVTPVPEWSLKTAFLKVFHDAVDEKKLVDGLGNEVLIPLVKKMLPDGGVENSVVALLQKLFKADAPVAQ